jgi:hypothetical protein
MSDQERYIQVLERENVALRNHLYRVRKLLDDAIRAAEPWGYADPDPEEQAALQQLIEEVLNDGE